MDKRPIGVFDSGIGGLTVLEEMSKVFSNEDFIYVGDQGHCPYGTKSNNEIEECVRNVGKWLLRRNCKAIVIACNTASVFKDAIVKLNSSVPVISVIEPTCDYAYKTSLNKRIVVCGTNATIKNNKYGERLEKVNATVFNVPASEFVDFVENKELDDISGDILVREKLEYLKDKNVDTFIHACTHFSLLEDKMKKVLGDINYVPCSIPTSMYLKEIMDKNDMNNIKHDRYIKIYTTGEVENAKRSMKWFKADHEEIKKINLED